MTSPSFEQVLLRARSERPELATVTDARFAAQLARHPLESERNVAAGDVLVVAGCLEGDRAALELFDRELETVVPIAVRHLGSASFVADLIQVLRVRLLVADDRAEPRIAGYSGSGPLGGFIRVAAIRLALNLRKAEDREGREQVNDLDLPSNADPELDYLRARYAGDLQRALTAAVQKLEPRDRALLRMHHARGMTVDELGKLFDVHRATAARWIVRARETLLASVKRELASLLAVDTRDAASLLRLVDSQLGLSLRGLLAETAG